MNRALWATAAVVVLALGACSKPVAPGARKAAPKEAANLPPRPSLTRHAVTEKFPDGAYSAEGFLRHARSMVGKEVAVRASVQAVETCPPEKERCDTVPHLVLVDDLGSTRHKVFVVADPPELFFKDIAVKSQQTMTGTVALWSPDGRLINLDGLLVVKMAPPGAPDAAASPAGASAHK